VAARLGSDVPFALRGGTAIGTGRGEQLTDVPVDGRLTWVVVTFRTGLSTPRVYERLDELRAGRDIGPPRVAEAVVSALKDADPVAVGRLLHNDLQAASVDVRPELARLLAAGSALGALGAIVSGSGPTCLFAVR